MSHIYRVFIRHEMETQPTWFKLRSNQSQAELAEEIHSAMRQPLPSLWQCVDIEHRSWIFRADKIYTVCVYPGEEEGTPVSSEHIHIS